MAVTERKISKPIIGNKRNQSDMRQTEPNQTKAWAVVIAAALFFFYEFIQMNFPNAINEELRGAFNLDAEGLGLLVSMYFWANAVFLLPAGSLLDRFSTKKILLGAVIVTTIGTFIFAIAKTFLIAAIGRFLVGSGAAFCFLSCIRLASRWFPPSRMALVTGVVVTMAMLGGFVAQSPMVLLTQWVGWRNAIMIDAGIGIIVVLTILLLVQDRPPHAKEHAIAEKAALKKLGFSHCFKLVLLNPYNWLGGLYTALMNLPVFALGGLWGIRYCMQVHHITAVQSSWATSMFFCGVIFGSPAFGWLSDTIGRRRLPMILGGIVSLGIFLTLMYVPHLSLPSIITLFFLIGFVTSSQVISYPTIAELNPIALTSTAVSVASMCIMSSGVIVLPLFGWLLESHWNHMMVNGEPFYSVHDFNTAMWIMPISFVIAIVLSFMIKETYCESQVEQVHH